MTKPSTKILDTEGEPIKCSERLYRGGYHPNSCYNNATVFRPASSGDGRYYCTTHDPVRKAEKRAAQHAKWDAAWNARNQAYKERRAESAVEIVACTDYDQALALFDRIRRH